MKTYDLTQMTVIQIKELLDTYKENIRPWYIEFGTDNPGKIVFFNGIDRILYDEDEFMNKMNKINK